MTQPLNRLPGDRIQLADGRIITEAERQRFRRARHAARTDDQIIHDRLRKWPDGLKFCGGCARHQPFSAFQDAPREKDGLHRRCYSCRPARSQA